MIIVKSLMFEKFDIVKLGFSTKIGLNREAPYYFNLSKSVGDTEKIVEENRKKFFAFFELNKDKVVIQKQVHSDIINIIEDIPRDLLEGDALITARKGIGLAVSSADCVPVFLYDRKKEVIAAVHSGWKGTEKRILFKTLQKMFERFKSEPGDIFAYIGPSISKNNYEVGEEVAAKFDKKYISEIEGRLYLDLKKYNYNMLITSGVPFKQIQVSGLCSFDSKDLLHSYRRDGSKSGRALGLIMLGE